MNNAPPKSTWKLFLFSDYCFDLMIYQDVEFLYTFLD